jgi:hypothetical protein
MAGDSMMILLLLYVITSTVTFPMNIFDKFSGKSSPIILVISLPFFFENLDFIYTAKY